MRHIDGRQALQKFLPFATQADLPDAADAPDAIAMVRSPQPILMTSDGERWVVLQASSPDAINVTRGAPGSGADFTSLQDAMDFLVAIGAPKNGGRHNVTILSGTTLTEQVHLTKDSNFVIWTSDDEVVPWDVAGFVVKWGEGIDPRKPALFCSGARGPVIFARFQGQGAISGDNTHGCLCMFGGSVEMYPQFPVRLPCGFTDFDINMRAASATVYRGNFDGAKRYGVVSENDVYLNKCNVRGAGLSALFIRENASIIIAGNRDDSVEMPSDPTRNTYQKSLGVNSVDDVKLAAGATFHDITNASAYGNPKPFGSLSSSGSFVRTGYPMLFQGIVGPETFTVATLPAAADHEHQYIHVSDGDAGSPGLAFSNGTDWIIVRSGVAASII